MEGCNSIMKILHYMLGLPPVRSGGLIKYVLDLIESEIKEGHEASLLIPGKMQQKKGDVCKIKKGSFKAIPCYRIENALPVLVGVGLDEVERLYEYGNEKVYKIFLQTCKPDIIHVHSLMGLHLAFLKAAKKSGIPIIYTTHDYYGLCLKASLLKQGQICNDSNWDFCSICQEKKASVKKLVIKQSEGYRLLEANRFYQWLKNSPHLSMLKLHFKMLYKKEKTGGQINPLNITKVSYNEKEKYEMLRNYYREMFACVTAFHFNSAQTKEIFETYLGRLNGRVLTVSNHMIKDCRRIKKQSRIVKIGFVGHGAETKGFHILKNALDELYSEGINNFECHIYFNLQEKTFPYMKQHMPYEENQAAEVYGNLDIVVMPSVWKETFGMVVLEALSYGVPVVVSKYAGAKDYLTEQPGMGIIVNPVKEELKAVLKELCQNPEKILEMNKQICAWKHEFSYETHVQEIIKFYNENLNFDKNFE